MSSKANRSKQRRIDKRVKRTQKAAPKVQRGYSIRDIREAVASGTPMKTALGLALKADRSDGGMTSKQLQDLINETTQHVSFAHAALEYYTLCVADGEIDAVVSQDAIDQIDRLVMRFSENVQALMMGLESDVDLEEMSDVIIDFMNGVLLLETDVLPAFLEQITPFTEEIDAMQLKITSDIRTKRPDIRNPDFTVHVNRMSRMIDRFATPEAA